METLIKMLLIYPSRAKQGRSIEILYRDLFKNAWCPVCVSQSVTSSSSHTSEAKGLKIGMLACIILT